MKTTQSFSHSGAIISRILYRYHIVLFVSVFLGGAAVIIFLLGQTITSSTDLTGDDPSVQTIFDQATIDSLDTLQSTDNTQPLAMPSGTRINPFVE